MIKVTCHDCRKVTAHALTVEKLRRPRRLKSAGQWLTIREVGVSRCTKCGKVRK